jgi:lysophospholipase L1-like esterase
MLLALASVLLVVLLAEGLLRWMPVDRSDAGLRDLHELRPEDPWIYGLKPGARATLEISGDVVYAINEDGYRGPRLPVSKPPGVLRVLVLGDSLAFGYGVAEEATFPRRLEQSLARRSPAEVLNFAVGGYNPYNEAALFAARGAGYSPDLVLVQFCINDLNDPTLHFDAQTRLHLGAIPEAAYPDPAERRGAASELGGWWRQCRRLRVCALIDDAWLALRKPARDAASVQATFAPREIPPGPARRWIAARYREIAREAAAIGARFAVVIFPYRDQLEARAPDRVQAQLAALAREQGFEVIDLLPSFRRAAEGSDDSLFLDAWHPTAAGHAVAAEAIHAQLEALRWLP